MPNVQLAHVKVVYETHPLPEVCPKCSAVLNNPGAVRMSRYDVNGYDGRLLSNKERELRPEEPTDQEFVYDPGSIHAILDEMIEGLDYWCASCDTVLLEGKFSSHGEGG